MFGALVLMASLDAQSGGDKQIDLKAAIDARTLKTNEAEVAASGQGVRITFRKAEWPGIYLALAAPEDWSGYAALRLDVSNPTKDPVPFNVRIDDAPESDGVTNCVYGHATIGPCQTESYLCPVGVQPMDLGLRAFPPIGDAAWMGGSGRGIDSKKVHKWLLFLGSPPAERTLVLRSARLVGASASLKGVVDPFGQFAKGRWPGKIADESDLKNAAEKEAQDIAKDPQLPERDAFGGWMEGPKREATGRFRTEKIDGKWWFVDPEGRLFWSMGVDCVNLGEQTMVTGREDAFQTLPPKGGPLGSHWGTFDAVHMGPVNKGETFDFRAANLERKYGSQWGEKALAMAARRLPAWGFNTIANWSDSRSWHRGVPYVVTAGVWGDHKRIYTGNDYWGPMHDVFDPAFKENVAQSLAAVPKSALGDKYCVGWFVDNELSWAGSGEENGRFGIAYGALKAGADSPAKQAFIGQLKTKYVEISRLNAAWGTDFASWETMGAPQQFTEEKAARRKDDLVAFVRLFAKTYFKTITDALRSLDPAALYLGTRFAWFGRDPVEVCAEYADVVSLNIYRPRLDRKEWEWVEQLGKPCIIGEFHFGATDRGMFHTGLVAVQSQKERAAMYEDYVRSVLDHPSFVGCHWFQYADQPLLGRALDGENYNIGLVNVVDIPYPEMVEAAKKVHGEAYARRFKMKL